MGYTPQQVGRMSYAQFMACLDGWIAANCPDSSRAAAPTSEEFARAKRLHGDA